VSRAGKSLYKSEWSENCDSHEPNDYAHQVADSWPSKYKKDGDEKENDKEYVILVEKRYRPSKPVSQELERGKYYEVAETNDCNQRV
ncbi:MAG: hypothetical protein DMF76_23370, partial [Acidobacteria bacterium]